jgi:uncharacterized protein YgiM (DUF1202 family)
MNKFLKAPYLGYIVSGLIFIILYFSLNYFAYKKIYLFNSSTSSESNSDSAIVSNSIISDNQNQNNSDSSGSSSSSNNISGSSRYGRINDKDGIRFRSGPGTNYEKLDLLNKGTRIEVLDTNGPEDFLNKESGRWYKIRYGGREGWLFGPFVDLE